MKFPKVGKLVPFLAFPLGPFSGLILCGRRSVGLCGLAMAVSDAVRPLASLGSVQTPALRLSASLPCRGGSNPLRDAGRSPQRNRAGPTTDAGDGREITAGRAGPRQSDFSRSPSVTSHVLETTNAPTAAPPAEECRSWGSGAGSAPRGREGPASKRTRVPGAGGAHALTSRAARPMSAGSAGRRRSRPRPPPVRRSGRPRGSV